QRTGLTTLSARNHSGISDNGTIAPPSIASTKSVAQPAPATARSLLPNPPSNIINPAKQAAVLETARTIPAAPCRRRSQPSQASNIKSDTAATQLVKQARALPASTEAMLIGAACRRRSVPLV